MKKELLEVVDDNNAVVKTADRTEVYLNGWQHRAVHVLLFDDQKRLLLQQRSFQKPTWPGLWDLSVAETMQPGESFMEAAQRGVREELNLTQTVQLIPVRELYKYTYQFGPYTLRGLISLYAGKYGGEIVTDEEEVAAIKWLPTDDVTTLIKQQEKLCTPWFIDDWGYTSQRLPKLFEELV